MMQKDKERPYNLVKHMAEELLPSVLQRFDIEDTPENHEDVLALALNHLPNKYVTTDSGKIYAQMIDNFTIQYETDVLASLTRAAITVKKRPRGEPRGDSATKGIR